MLIKNGLVFLLDERGYSKKDILVKNDKIIKIADCIDGVCDIDAAGKYVTPGLIEAHSHIGICEEIIGWAGDDCNEESSPVVTQCLAIDAINPFDIALHEALTGGVTVACTGPGSGEVVSGTFATIKLTGKVIDEMVINKDAAMKVAFGENPKGFGKKDKEPATRMGVAALLRKTLNDAKNYKAHKEEAKKEGKLFATDLGMEQMLLVIDKKMPLKAHAHRADDICTAIRIAREYDVNLTLDHCTEGHLITDYLKQFKYPAIVGPSYGCRSKIELKNKTFETPKILNEAGIKICITTDHDVYPQYSLIMFAALSVKAGLDSFEAMKAITINPAEVLKIDNIKGQIKEGLDADIVIWDREPLDLQAKVESVYIEGKKVL